MKYVSRKRSAVDQRIVVAHYLGHEEAVTALYASNGFILSISEDNTIREWDLTRGNQVGRCARHDEGVSGFARIDATRLASIARDGSVKIWHIPSGQELFQIVQPNCRYTSAAMTEQGKLLLGSEDGTISVWDVQTKTEVRRIGSKVPIIFKQTFGDGKYRTNPQGRAMLSPLLGFRKGGVANVQVFGQHIITETDDGNWKVWDLESGTELKALHWPDELQWADTRDTAALDSVLAATDDSLFFVDVWTGKRSSCVKCVGGEFSAVIRVGKDEALSGSKDGRLRLWSIKHGKRKRKESRLLEGHTWTINTLALCTKDRAISGSDDRTLRLWDLKTGSQLAVWEGDAAITGVFFLDDFNLCVAGDAIGGVHWIRIKEDGHS